MHHQECIVLFFSQMKQLLKDLHQYSVEYIIHRRNFGQEYLSQNARDIYKCLTPEYSTFMVMTLGKLFTHMLLSASSTIYTGHKTVIVCK